MPGQLIRETNPAQGFAPSLVPQHEDVNGDYKKTGEVNPLPVSIEDSGSAAAVDLQYHAIPVSNPIPVKAYSGVIQGHNAVSIRDTTSMNDLVIDVSQLTGEKQIIVSSTLNQNVNLTAYSEGTNYSFAIMGTPKAISSGAVIMTSNEWGALKGSSPKIRLRLQATVAPTTGSISSFIEGVQE